MERDESAAGPRPRAGPDNRVLTVVRDGTSITLVSDLEPHTLQAVAHSLVPAPTEPPAVETVERWRRCGRREAVPG